MNCSNCLEMLLQTNQLYLQRQAVRAPNLHSAYRSPDCLKQPVPHQFSANEQLTQERLARCKQTPRHKRRQVWATWDATSADWPCRTSAVLETVSEAPVRRLKLLLQKNELSQAVQGTTAAKTTRGPCLHTVTTSCSCKKANCTSSNREMRMQQGDKRRTCKCLLAEHSHTKYVHSFTIDQLVHSSCL